MINSDVQIRSFRNILKQLILSLILVTCHLANSQPNQKSVFKYLNTNQGLSSASVNDFYQDKFGFIWIATRNGLNRYDGEKIVSYGTALGLANPFIYKIGGSNSDSLLWLATRGGVAVFDRYDNSFTNLDLQEGDENVMISLLSEDSVIWAGGFSGLFRISQDSVCHFKHDSLDQYSLSSPYVLGVHRKGEELYLATYAGLNVLDLNTKKFINSNNSKASIFQEIPDFTQSFYEAKNGALWTSSFEEYIGGTLIKIEEGTVKTYRNDPKDKNSLNYNFGILAIIEDRHENLWVGANGGGIGVLNRKKDIFNQITFDPKNQNGLNDIDVWALKYDSKNVMWVGTDGGSINKYHEDYDRFELYQNNPYEINSINATQILAIEDTEDYVFLGTNAATGLSRYDKKTGTFFNYPFENDELYSLWDNTVYALEKVHGYLWVGSNAGGLSRLDIKQNTFKHFIGTTGGLTPFDSDYITGISAKNDELFLATGSGLSSINMRNFEKQNYGSKDEKRPVYDLVLQDDLLWLALEEGLKLFEVSSRSFITVPQELTNIKEVNCMYQAGESIYFGTNEGLFIWNSSHLRQITTTSGLSNNLIMGIATDKENRLWITTKNGLNMINEEGEVTHYSTLDGLPNNSFNQRAITLGEDGTMYVGGDAGYIAFDPKKFERKTHVTNALLLTARIYENENVIAKSLLNKTYLELNYDQSNFKIDFFVPDYINPDKLKFRYKIDGLSDQVFDLGNQSELNVTDLSHGNYTFQIDNTNTDGVWSKNPTELNVKVNPPFWLTWYAFCFYGLLIIAAFFARERYQKAEKRKLEAIVIDRTSALAKQKDIAVQDAALINEQSERLKELDKVKTRFFSNISHEFRTPLTLIQGPIESILQGRAKGEAMIKKNLEVATRNVKNLRNLIDEILEFNKLDLGELDITYVPVLMVDYLDELSENYAALITDEKLQWKLNHTLSDKLQLNLPLDKVEKIIQNLLSNAIKHSPKGGKVSLDVSYSESMLKLKVADQGKGIAQEESKKVFERFYQSSDGKLMPHSSGIGLAYVKEITAALGGTIDLKSNLNQGTVFVFSLPAETTDLVISPQIPTDGNEEDELIGSKYIYQNNKILLTEDNEEMANYIKQVLGDEFEIQWAENGQKALDKLESFDADLIITDIMMPVMDGLTLLGKLKADDRYKYKSIIMLTAKSSQETRLDALSFGLDDYLTKPFNPTELEIRVKNLLRNQHERAEWVKNEDNSKSKPSDPLIDDLISEIERNLDNRNFGVLELSNRASLSDRQLTRITKKSIGLTPANLIKEVKLQKAKHYLETRTYRSMSEVCYAVGFEKPSYFSKIYFERYGKKPSSYLV